MTTDELLQRKPTLSIQVKVFFKWKVRNKQRTSSWLNCFTDTTDLKQPQPIIRQTKARNQYLTEISDFLSKKSY